MFLQVNLAPAGLAAGQPEEKKPRCPSFFFLGFILNQLVAGIFSEAEPNCRGRGRDFLLTGLLWVN